MTGDGYVGKHAGPMKDDEPATAPGWAETVRAIAFVVPVMVMGAAIVRIAGWSEWWTGPICIGIAFVVGWFRRRWGRPPDLGSDPRDVLGDLGS